MQKKPNVTLLISECVRLAVTFEEMVSLCRMLRVDQETKLMMYEEYKKLVRNAIEKLGLAEHVTFDWPESEKG